MKYRRLNQQELEGLESVFIQFLASYSLPGPDWEKLKTEDPDAAERIIELFSDMVYEQTLQNVDYLEWVAPLHLRSIYCHEDRMELRALLLPPDAGIDLRKVNDLAGVIDKLQAAEVEVKFVTGEKEFGEDRSKEIFELMEQGALISQDGRLFDYLGNLINPPTDQDAAS